MPSKELWEAYSNHIVRPPVRPSVPLHVQCISLILCEAGIPNLVYLKNIGMAKCRVPFSGHCDLDLDP